MYEQLVLTALYLKYQKILYPTPHQTTSFSPQVLAFQRKLMTLHPQQEKWNTISQLQACQPSCSTSCEGAQQCLLAHRGRELQKVVPTKDTAPSLAPSLCPPVAPGSLSRPYARLHSQARKKLLAAQNSKQHRNSGPAGEKKKKRNQPKMTTHKKKKHKRKSRW